MILLFSIGLSVALALLTGGRLSRLARVPFKLGWLTFVALGLQVASVYSSKPTWVPGALLIGSYALLVAVVLANLRVPGVAVIGLGLAANLAVIAANGGYMPVTSEAVSRAGLEQLVTTTDVGTEIFGSKDIVLPYSDTRLWALSDIVILRWPFPTVVSLGDVILAAGAFWFIFRSLHSEHPTATL